MEKIKLAFGADDVFSIYDFIGITTYQNTKFLMFIHKVFDANIFIFFHPINERRYQQKKKHARAIKAAPYTYTCLFNPCVLKMVVFGFPI